MHLFFTHTMMLVWKKGGHETIKFSAYLNRLALTRNITFFFLTIIFSISVLSPF